MRYIKWKEKVLGMTALILAAAAFCCIMDAQRIQREAAESVLRLHITANSDSEADQRAKLEVRDAVLEYLAPELEDCGDMPQARAKVEGLLGEISRVADERAKQLGQSGAAAELAVESFPQKSYGDFTLPAGEYTALRITVGSGEGHNWWCVVFPQLCIGAAARPEEALAAAGMEQDAIRAVTSQPKVRFFLLDLFRALIG